MALVEAILIITKKSSLLLRMGVGWVFWGVGGCVGWGFFSFFFLPLAQITATCSCSLSYFPLCVCEQSVSSMWTCHLVLIMLIV